MIPGFMMGTVRATQFSLLYMEVVPIIQSKIKQYGNVWQLTQSLAISSIKFKQCYFSLAALCHFISGSDDRES